MLSLSNLKAGTLFVMDGDPWEILEANFVKMAQRTGHLEAKIRNLRTGNVLTRSFKQADTFKEAEVERVNATFIYAHRGSYVFSDVRNPRERFTLTETQAADKAPYLVSGLAVAILRFNGEVIGIELPPKADLRVTEAPPWVKGDTAAGGVKTVTVENGLRVRTPPFIETGNVIRVNTRTGEYVERVEKSTE